MRITSDCPLIDPYLCNNMLNYFMKNNFDYMSNILERTFPVGLDCEIFTMKALKKTIKTTKSRFNQEHVTPYMRNPNRFNIKNFYNNHKVEKQRWTLDYPLDLKFINKAFEKFNARKKLRWYRLYKLYKKDAKNKKYINQKYII